MVAIFYYSTDFFKSAGIDASQAQYATIGVGAILVLMTLITIPLMDRVGRRILHLVSPTDIFFSKYYQYIVSRINYKFNKIKFLSS